jgi:hypothetical protein
MVRIGPCVECGVAPVALRKDGRCTSCVRREREGAATARVGHWQKRDPKAGGQ